MMDDYTSFLWLLKLGAFVNIYFFVSTAVLTDHVAAPIVIPAQILFGVSAYRCLFPVRYEHNVVFHESVFSSVFVTRLLATFSEVAFIFLFSHLLRLLNVDHVGWVSGLSWLMVLQVIVSQILVWAAILTGRFQLYYYEELGWALIFGANTIASAYLYLTSNGSGAGKVLLLLNLVYGAIYLPFQFVHLRTLHLNASRHGESTWNRSQSIREMLAIAIRTKNRRTDAESWGGLVGLIWMTGYWATLIPMWVYYIVRVLTTH